MNQHTLLPTSMAQIVRPYDPNADPLPVTAQQTQNLLGPLAGLGIALGIVIFLVLFVLRKRKKHRR